MSHHSTRVSENLTELATEFTDWSIQTFISADAETSVKKLIKEESYELLVAVLSNNKAQMKEEFADCLMCLFDAAMRAGITPIQLTKAFAVKLETNKSRQWRRNESGTYSHIKP